MSPAHEKDHGSDSERPPLIPTVPELEELQTAFSEAMRTPIDFSNGTFRFQQEKYSDFISEAALPFGTLSSRERVCSYNSQYWYRLLDVLQSQFPLLSQTITYWRFNQLAAAYLEKHPPTDPTLDPLGRKLPAFLRSQSDLQPDFLELARLEEAWHRLFTLAEKSPIRTQSETTPLDPTQIRLQPATEVLPVQTDMITHLYRFQVQNEPEKFSFTSHALSQNRFCLLYRLQGKMGWEYLEPWQATLLVGLRNTGNLEEACEQVIDAHEEDLGEEWESAVIDAFTRWGRMGIFFSSTTEEEE